MKITQLGCKEANMPRYSLDYARLFFPLKVPGTFNINFVNEH